MKYGALPLAFEVSEVSNVSATLGGEQLRAGIIAGIIGLALVVAFCFLYYRGLGIVVVTSLAHRRRDHLLRCMVLLGSSVGFALNLPGIAGAIVAIGVTADSFVIYFERIRDEVRDGRSLRTAVETGWQRARQTILIADAVSMLSAIILFVLAIGSVKGFAFTLGLTTHHRRAGRVHVHQAADDAAGPDQVLRRRPQARRVSIPDTSASRRCPVFAARRPSVATVAAASSEEGV